MKVHCIFYSLSIILVPSLGYSIHDLLIQNNATKFDLFLNQSSIDINRGAVLFVFDDASFLELPESVQNKVLSDKVLRENLMRHHILNDTSFMNTTVTDGMMIQSILPDDYLVFNNYTSNGSSHIITVNGVNITKASGRVGNISVHFIGGVLYPIPFYKNGKDYLKTEPSAVMFNLLTDFAGYELPSGKTIVVPRSFSSLNFTYFNEIIHNRKELKHLIKKHILSERFLFSSELLARKTALNFFNESINVDISDDVLKLNDSIVLEADIQTKDNIIHVLDYPFL